jgi:hypothetical protein
MITVRGSLDVELQIGAAPMTAIAFRFMLVSVNQVLQIIRRLNASKL